ncbi:MAG: cation transporter [Oscillospiraceae bacterium]|nr:cation transporter [Oscillospiraceae bacterium]
MTALLVKLFIKDSEKINDKKVRTAYGVLSSITGIVLNLILAGAKYAAGVISGSISITADAINNLSDAGSSIVSFFGVKISAKPADKDHPYGHGRVEYISAFIVAFFVLFMGIELFKDSVGKIINPEPVKFSFLSLAILIFSIIAKLWLGIFNKTLGKKINSAPMMAVMKDSFSDCLATGVAAVSIIVSAFSDINIDGYLGLIVAIFIFIAGFGILKETLGNILGRAPEEEFVDEITEKILSYPHICGVHDMIIHDYGPSCRFASVHAEVPSNEDIMELHDIIDGIERDIYNEYGMLTSIHMDPVVINDERINELRKITENAVASVDERLTIHDFRVVEGPSHTNLIFDTLLPRDIKCTDREICQKIEEALGKIDERFFCVITVDHAFH